MRRIIMTTMLLIATSAFHLYAQNAETTEPYKIVFQLVTDDTTAHKAFMKQLNNILTTQPETKIEVVCHGPGLNMLVEEKSIVAHRISHFVKSGVVFNACEFSMTERKVAPEQILPDIKYVKAGILAIVEKQSQGWFYIKAGF